MNTHRLFKTDYSAIIFATLRAVINNCYSVCCTFIMRMKCKLMKIEIGHNVRFNGVAKIERFKYSKIIVGNNVTFNSSDRFNARGIGHCILQTSTDKAIIEIGDNSGLSGVSIVANVGVRIGKRVMIGADTKIGDRDDHHEIFGNTDAPIQIGDDVFIGMRCLIMKGVTIGRGSIIGAGSVVTKDIPEGVVAAGVPCKVIRKR